MITKRYLIVALIILCSGALKAQEYTLAQDRLKTIYTFNFLKDIQWPSYLSDDAIQICALGRIELYEELKNLNTKEIGGRKLNINKISKLSECNTCDLIFIDYASKEFKRDGDCSSLIITFGFFDKSLSNVVLMFQEQKLQFSINRALCDKYGYKVSGHLIGLSKLKL